MKNFVQPGEVLTLAAPYDRLSGQGALMGCIFGVAKSDVLSGATGEFLIEGVVTLAKTSAQAWTRGDRIYWDDTNKRLDNTGVVGQLVGYATAAAASPSSTGTIRLSEGVSGMLQGKQAAVTALTAATGSASTTLADVTATPTQTLINNNFKSVATQLNLVIAALQAVGILT